MGTEGRPSCSRQDPPPVCGPAPRPAHPPRGSAPGPTAENRKSIRKGNTGGGPACTQRQGPASSCARCRQPDAPLHPRPPRSARTPSLQTPTLPGLDREGGARCSTLGCRCVAQTQERLAVHSSASPSARASRGCEESPVLQLPCAPQCGLGTGREEPLLPGSPFTRCSRWFSTRGDSPRSAGRGAAGQVASKAVEKPGSHGSHGRDGMEHPQTERELRSDQGSCSLCHRAGRVGRATHLQSKAQC